MELLSLSVCVCVCVLSFLSLPSPSSPLPHVEHIPMTNLRALVKYVEHPGWPDLGRLPSASPKKRNPVKARGDANNDNALRRQMIQDGSLPPPDQIEEDEDAPVPALVRLTEWANAVIQYARLLAEEGGPSPTMNRKSSDFERYVFVCCRRRRRRRRLMEFVVLCCSLFDVVSPWSRTMRPRPTAASTKGGGTRW